MKILGRIKNIRKFKNISFLDIFSENTFYQVSLETKFLIEKKLRKEMFIAITGEQYFTRIGWKTIKIKTIQILSQPNCQNYFLKQSYHDFFYKKINFLSSLETFLKKHNFKNIYSRNNIYEFIFNGINKNYFIENNNDRENYLSLFLIKTDYLNIEKLILLFVKKFLNKLTPFAKLNFDQVMTNYLKLGTNSSFQDIKKHLLQFELLDIKSLKYFKNKNQLFVHVFNKFLKFKLIGINYFTNFPNQKNNYLSDYIFWNDKLFAEVIKHNSKKITLKNVSNNNLHIISFPDFIEVKIKLSRELYD
ncbi:hypothetical protein ACW95P_01555 [Candidatus Mycoplasma pogonae]